MTKDEIQAVLDLHGKWLRGEEGRQRADLRHADLRRADLRGADLYGANLRGADLYGANLRGADLSGADLSSANLSGADLSSANLSRANLSRANLRDADLRDADLYGADLSDANLGGANLSRADLPNGVKWETYISETVPALLTVGGKALADLRPAFTCHQWTNCPMAEAFGVYGLEKIPSLYRSEAALFVTLFDGKAITEELIFGAAVSV